VATGLLVFAAAPPAALAGWAKPFEFTKPGTLDLIPTQLASAGSGASAAAFGVEDVDTPGNSQAYVASRSPGGSVAAPLAIGSAKRILGLSYDGSALELLTGISPSALSCCSCAQAVWLTANGTLQRPHTLVGGLAGFTQGRLLALKRGMLAAVATERGLWVVQAARSNRFGGQHRLSRTGQFVVSMDAAWLGGQSTIVAWTSANGPAGTAAPRKVSYALGSKKGAPHKVQTLVTVPIGHRIDELAVARRGSRATAAWVESWYDKKGNFHSEVRAADVAANPGIRTLSSPAQPASGMAMASDAAGDQGIAWKSCRSTGSCTAQAAFRGAKTTFGRTVSFGSLDAGEIPAVAVGPKGQAIVAWVRGGVPMASVGSAPRGRGFDSTKALSNTRFAADITVTYGPRRQAIAAWSQGTLNPSVVGAAYTG
jgi:hypothetical protein